MKFKNLDEFKDDGSGYGSHLPVLKFLFSISNINKVLEFGMGHFSTEFFLMHGCEVTSTEMQEESWYKEMLKSVGKNNKWTPFLKLGPSLALETPVPGNEYDLAFIDGHLNSRPECVNACFGKVPIIIAHDFECSVYGWERIKMPSFYKKVVFHQENTQVVVFIIKTLFQ